MAGILRTSPALACVPIAAVAFLVFSPQAAANPLKCNKPQTKCEVISSLLTVGDRIAVINPSDETVAIGEVERVEGNSRYIGIRKKMAKITARDRFEIINPGQESKFLASAVRTPVKASAGAALGVTSLSAGGGAPGLELSGFYSRRITAKGQLVGRGSYAAVGGEITGSDGLGTTRTKTCSYGILTGMAGISHPLVGLQKFSLLGEVDAGFAYVSESCGEAEGAANTPEDSGETWSEELTGGVGLAARGTIVAAFAMKGWKLTGGYAFGLIKNKTAHTMHVGFVFEWL